MTRYIVRWIQWITYSISCGSFLQWATLGSFNVISSIWLSKLFPVVVLSKDTETLCACLGSSYIICSQTCNYSWIIPSGRQALRLATLYIPNLNQVAIFISSLIRGVQGVCSSHGHELCLGNIWVIISVETIRALPRLVSDSCLCALDIIKFHNLAGFDIILLDFLGSRTIYIINFHVIPNEAWRCKGSLFYNWHFILGV